MSIQKVLAWFDRLIGCESISTPGSDGAARNEYYYGDIGPRFGIIHRDGFMEIGGYFQVIHRYDNCGKLLSRQLRRKILREDDKLIIGNRAVYKAYSKSKNSNVGQKMTGMEC